MKGNDSTASGSLGSITPVYGQSEPIPSPVGRESDYPTMPELIRKPDHVLIY
jgi:hypothetical protein